MLRIKSYLGSRLLSLGKEGVGFGGLGVVAVGVLMLVVKVQGLFAWRGQGLLFA